MKNEKNYVYGFSYAKYTVEIEEFHWNISLNTIILFLNSVDITTKNNRIFD